MTYQYTTCIGSGISIGIGRAYRFNTISLVTINSVTFFCRIRTNAARWRETKFVNHQRHLKFNQAFEINLWGYIIKVQDIIGKDSPCNSLNLHINLPKMHFKVNFFSKGYPSYLTLGLTLFFFIRTKFIRTSKLELPHKTKNICKLSWFFLQNTLYFKNVLNIQLNSS